MVEGKIYWCDKCNSFLRYENICADCNRKGSEIGFMKTNEEM